MFLGGQKYKYIVLDVKYDWSHVQHYEKETKTTEMESDSRYLQDKEHTGATCAVLMLVIYAPMLSV